MYIFHSYSNTLYHFVTTFKTKTKIHSCLGIIQDLGYHYFGKTIPLLKTTPNIIQDNLVNLVSSCLILTPYHNHTATKPLSLFTQIPIYTPGGHGDYKMVLVVRQDLGMGKGKIAAQVY